MSIFEWPIKVDSIMIIRSSAYSSSHGQHMENSLDKASNMIMKRSGLRTEPWWTPTPNSSLYPSPTLTLLLTSLYMDWTSWTSHLIADSFLANCTPDDISWNSVESFLQVHKGNIESLVWRQVLRYLVWDEFWISIEAATTRHKAKLHFIYPNSLPDQFLHNMLKHVLHLLIQL